MAVAARASRKQLEKNWTDSIVMVPVLRLKSGIGRGRVSLSRCYSLRACVPQLGSRRMGIVPYPGQSSTELSQGFNLSIHKVSCFDVDGYALEEYSRLRACGSMPEQMAAGE